MMEQLEVICIECPLGCMVRLDMENGTARNIFGYSCKRGEAYALKEITSPVRMVTSTMKVKNGERPLVSVKTNGPIPKNKIFECMAEINRTEAIAPVSAGDVLIGNAANTGIAIIATKDVGAV